MIHNTLTLFKTTLISILILLSFQSEAQVNCKASAPSQVSVGQSFNFSITLNEQGKVIATNFNGFDVLGGPNTSSSTSMSITNGTVTKSSSYTYSYVLQATKEGSFTIPPVTMNVNGKQVKSNSVTITVVKGNNTNSSNGTRTNRNQQQAAPNFDKSDVFVKAYASKDNPYQGEQVIITHKLYVGQGVNGGYQVNGATMPSQKGFWTYTLGDPDAEAPAKTEVLNGKRYTVHEIRRTAAFPQQSGSLTVTPFELDFMCRVIYQVQTNDPFDFFFGGGQRAQDYNWKIKSNSLKINAKPLPENGRPADFSGVVGDFTMTATLSRNELKANDATNLIITIKGNGNIQHIEALPIDFPSDFDVTDPKISDNINTMGNGVTGSRSFEYVIIPRSAGNFTIPSSTFSYFDSKSGKYKTLETPEFKLKIAKGDGNSGVVSSSNKKDIKKLWTDIRFIKAVNNGFSLKHLPLFGTPWYFLGLLLPLILFILFIIIWRKKIEERQNVAETRNRRANKVARKRLKNAEKLLKTNEKEAFYVEISRVLWGYMSDKFKIPLAQLSMETVEAKLREKSLSEEAIQDFISTLDQCEFARFAPGDASEMMHNMYDLSMQFITKIEKKN
ncbi:MAG: BatD family protein [Bacteroidales bacterium]|nr:BatD family protein [Bacteroidales bacterium]